MVPRHIPPVSERGVLSPSTSAPRLTLPPSSWPHSGTLLSLTGRVDAGQLGPRPEAPAPQRPHRPGGPGRVYARTPGPVRPPTPGRCQTAGRRSAPQSVPRRRLLPSHGKGKRGFEAVGGKGTGGQVFASAENATGRCTPGSASPGSLSHPAQRGEAARILSPVGGVQAQVMRASRLLWVALCGDRRRAHLPPS